MIKYSDELLPKEVNENEFDEEENEQILYNEEEELMDSNEDASESENENEKEGSDTGGKVEAEDEDNIELQGEGIVEIDYDGNNFDDGIDNIHDGQLEKLNELLFCVQGIGKFTDDKKTIYEKGVYCEPSMRDIHRFLRKDDPENPIIRLFMLKWKVCESDIVPLILNYENNEKIQQLGLVLLVDITERLPDLLENRTAFDLLLTDLQEYLVKGNLTELLSRSLADSTAKLREASIMKNELRLIENQEAAKCNAEAMTEEERLKTIEIKRKIGEIENKSQQLIELILAFFKQLLNITSTSYIQRNLNSHITLLKKFSQLKIFDAIVFHSQSYETEFYKRLSGTILELVYYIIRPFRAQDLFTSNLEGKYVVRTELQRLREEEKQQKLNRKSMYSTRPNKFGTCIKISRPLDNTSFMVSNLSQLEKNPNQVIAEKTNQFKNQRKKTKKTSKFLLKPKFASKAGEEITLINDIKISVNFKTQLDESSRPLLLFIKTFCVDFMTNSFNELVKHFFFEINSFDRIEKYDIYHLMRVMSFFLDFNRYYHTSLSNETGKNNFNVHLVRESISPEMMTYIYNQTYMEATKQKSDGRKLYELYGGVSYIKNVLLTSFDLYKNKTDDNLSYNVLIQDYMITKDLSKIIKSCFVCFNDGYHPKELLYDPIELIEVYFAGLEIYTKKRKLTKKIKKKSKKRRGEDNEEEKLLKKFIEQDKHNRSDDSDEHTGSVSMSEDEEDEYIEKDLDVNSESKCLLDYEIITRIISLFNVSNNSTTNMTSLLQLLTDLKRTGIVKFITKIFERICFKMKEPWIFYQMDYLFTFNNLLNDSNFKNDGYYANFKGVILNIINSFFGLLRKNKLLAVESLVRFTSLIMKDSILNNYDTIYEEPQKDNAESQGDDHSEGEYKFKDEIEEEHYNDNFDVNNLPSEKKPKKKLKRKYVDLSDEDPKGLPRHLNLNDSHSDKGKTDWTENEDMGLIKSYFEFKDYEQFYDILSELFPNKSKKELKRRIKKLKLKRGMDKAMKRFNKLHKKSKQTKRKNLTDIIIELSDECRNDVKKNKIEKTINAIKGQLESFKIRKGLMDDVKEMECVLIPTSEEEIDTMQDEIFQSFIRSIGLQPPEGGEEKKFWSVNPGTDELDLSLLISKLDDFERRIKENVIYDDQVRLDNKRKAKEDRKLKKKLKKEKNKKERKDESDPEVPEQDEEKFYNGDDIASKRKSEGSKVPHSVHKSLKSVISLNEQIESNYEFNQPPTKSVMSEVFEKPTKRKLKKGLKQDDNYDYMD